MFNPDYPTSTGNFLQHTYQPVQNMNESFYYSGGGINPFANQMGAMSDSRRMMSGNPSTPMGQTAQNGQQQLMPFSSYPPATPQVTNGFNALVESRRNTNVATPQQTNTNPWATNPMAGAPIQPVQQNPVYPQMMMPQSNFNMHLVPTNCNALYSNQAAVGFDRKAGCWDNAYTNPNPAVFTPTIDWRSAQPTYQNPMYPMAQYPQTNASWLEMAEKNWESVSYNI